MHCCRDEANEEVKVAATLVIGRWLTRAGALHEAVTKRFADGLKDKDAVKKATLKAYGRVRTMCNKHRAASGSILYRRQLATRAACLPQRLPNNCARRLIYLQVLVKSCLTCSIEMQATASVGNAKTRLSGSACLNPPGAL